MSGIDLQEVQSRHSSLIVDDQQFPIVYRHNKRAKRFSMRVSSDYQRLSITLPSKGTHKALQQFLDTCADWVAKHRTKWATRTTQAVPFLHGAVLPILGRSRQLHVDTLCESSTIVLKEDGLIIPAPLFHADIIQTFFNEILLEYVTHQSNAYAAQLKTSLNRVRIKPLKSSYGICRSNKTITYASKLVFAPRESIDYVCAHEVAHLLEMNHSPAFWSVVQSLMPNYKHPKAWLASNGYNLNLYGKPLTNSPSND
jgi:predicted metal-dependent hydrolase